MSVSLVDLVENERAKELLKESEEHMASGDAQNAIVAVARAYHGWSARRGARSLSWRSRTATHWKIGRTLASGSASATFQVP